MWSSVHQKRGLRDTTEWPHDVQRDKREILPGRRHRSPHRQLIPCFDQPYRELDGAFEARPLVERCLQPRDLFFGTDEVLSRLLDLCRAGDAIRHRRFGAAHKYEIGVVTD
jgi:hypothetical protein